MSFLYAVGTICLLSFAHAVALSIYRLYFHPLVSYPGPKSVAVTRWVEFYYDVIKGGRFIWEIEKMHEKHGLIIRVSPDEIHIMDPGFYNHVYKRVKLDKDPSWCNLAAARSSILTTAPHALHRLRRGALNSFFSKHSILRLESVIQGKVDKLCLRLKSMAGNDISFRLDVAFMALTSDILSEYAFAACYNYLDNDDFNLEWKKTIVNAVSTGALLRQFPSLANILKRMPSFIVDHSPLKQLAKFKRDMRHQIKHVMAMPVHERGDDTIFHALLTSNLPSHEKTLQRLSDEGQILYGAGSETTAKALTTIAFHLLRSPHILANLRAELCTARTTTGNDSLTLTQLEQCHYITAIINEGLRLAGGVTTRTPRISPDHTLTYKHFTIPAGTPVSQTAYFTLMDSSIFPSPASFLPDRWISPDGSFNRHLLTYMVAFGRGSRNCLGMNLAWAELYLCIAAVFGGQAATAVEMVLCDGVAEVDVTVARDGFVGMPVEGKGAVWTRTLLID